MPLQRWCPTPEQLMILEEIYKGGIRTPKACHIHKITAHLSQYGKIEGKNVFYWFQNHKARDRQKLRRKQLFLAKQQQNYHYRNSPPFLYYQPLFLAKQQNYHPLNSQYNLPSFLHQGTGGVENASSIQLMKPYTLKANGPPAATCEEKSVERLYGQDHHWMIMDVDPASCTNRGPVKTLQLFPTTSTTTSMHKP